MQCLGAPKNPILSMFCSLQDASQKVRTVYGDSTKTYRKKQMSLSKPSDKATAAVLPPMLLSVPSS
jgi:hypothetical protein